MCQNGHVVHVVVTRRPEASALPIARAIEISCHTIHAAPGFKNNSHTMPIRGISISERHQRHCQCGIR